VSWLANLFTKYPEMGVYLAVGIGYLVGRLKFHGVGLGVVTGSLLGGIFIGNFFHVPVSDQAKSMLSLLFLFGIGYSAQLLSKSQGRGLAMGCTRCLAIVYECRRNGHSHS
jgi:putative transport protein